MSGEMPGSGTADSAVSTSASTETWISSTSSRKSTWWYSFPKASSSRCGCAWGSSCSDELRRRWPKAAAGSTRSSVCSNRTASE